MAVPFASAYAPINTLNAAIQAQDQFGQNVGLQRRQMDDQMVMATMNRILQQKALQQQSADRQQHYGLQQQQLQNDLAYRHQALTAAAAEQTERKRQFDRVATMNEAIAKSQIERPRLDPSALPAALQINERNADARGIADNIKIALADAKKTRDEGIEEIKRVRGNYWPLTSDFWNDVFTSNSAWAKQAMKYVADHRATVAAITQGAQGKVSIKPKVDKDGVPIPDEYDVEAIELQPIDLPGMRQPGQQVNPSALPDLGIFPAGYGRPPTTGASRTQAPVFNPFSAYSAMRHQQAQPANVRTNAPPDLMLNPQTRKFVPVQ